MIPALLLAVSLTQTPAQQTEVPYLVLPDGGTRAIVLEAHEVSSALALTDGGPVTYGAGVWLSPDTAEYQARKIVEHEAEPVWTPWWATLIIGVVTAAAAAFGSYCVAGAPPGTFCSVKK